MEEQKSRKFRFSTLGIILGIFLVIMSLIWVTRAVISGNEQSGEEATWVG